MDHGIKKEFRMSKKVPLVVFLVMFGLLSACSNLETKQATPLAVMDSVSTEVLTANEIPEIRIEAADFSYSVSEPITAGWVGITLTNSGAEAHHIQFLRLNDGVTFDQFQDALLQGEGPALALTEQVGGVGTIAPAGTAQALLNLPAGEYAILCFVPSPTDHLPHLAKGMVQSLTVEAATSTRREEPTADLTIELKDFMFDMPETLPAGDIMIEIVNQGPEAHEWNVLRLAEGRILEDVMAYLENPQGPPPFTPIGGMNGLAPGKNGYVEFNLTSGSYVAICNIPSPAANGMAHSALGMVMEFSVP
jgi:hypothetical protein